MAQFVREINTLRKVTTAHRSEIAALKRQVKVLESERKAGIRASKTQKTTRATALPVPPSRLRFKFKAERFAAWRAKVGITRVQTAKLVEASSLSVYKWETDQTQPRAAQLERIAAVMKMGKREVLKKLQES